MADLIENCRRHRVMIGLLTVLGALLLGVRAQQEVFRLVGSDVTLVPKYTGDLREIKWILDDRILVEIILKPQEEFIHHLTNDRATINKTNGALTIRNLDRGDSGDYKAQAVVNSIEYTEIRLTVGDCPAQPIISVESTKDRFELSCKSFSPNVTYEWFNQTTSVSKGRLYAEPKKNGTLTCVVANKECKKSSSINFYIPAQPEVKSLDDNVILVPKYTGNPSEIIWKVNCNNLVKMKPRVDFIFYRLQNRANINDTDGNLTIRHLTMEDYGVYTAVVLVNNEYYYTEIRLAQKQELRLVGSDVTLVPQYTGDLKEIKWILNNRVMVEVILKSQEETLNLIDLPNNRTTINKTNGALTIRYLTIWDSGVYKAEVILMNNYIQVTEITLTVRDCPKQPIISVKSFKDWFELSCESSPDVTYEWFNQTRSMRKSQSYVEPKKNGTLTCVVDNEVCNKSSSINFYIPAQPEVKSVGDNVILVPKYTGDPSKIIWKVNGNKLVEMVLKPRVDRIFYRLQDRANISDPDGNLTIRHLTKEDYGVYTAVVLVNNEYYYMEIRLEYSDLPGWIIIGIVIGVLVGIIILLLWYRFYKKKCCREKSSTPTSPPQNSNTEGAEVNSPAVNSPQNQETETQD